MSIYQKSIRGSDVNAALHYLGRLVEAGDLVSIARRLVVIAYEDIALANPQAGPRALAAVEAAERLGFPEARIPLANSVIELCLSPKSNTAIVAIDAALSDIRSGHSGDVPDHLKDAHYKGATELGRGIDYLYPHDYENGWVKQQYLPDKLRSKNITNRKRAGNLNKPLPRSMKISRKEITPDHFKSGVFLLTTFNMRSRLLFCEKPPVNQLCSRQYVQLSAKYSG